MSKWRRRFAVPFGTPGLQLLMFPRDSTGFLVAALHVSSESRGWDVCTIGGIARQTYVIDCLLGVVWRHIVWGFAACWSRHLLRCWLWSQFLFCCILHLPLCRLCFILLYLLVRPIFVWSFIRFLYIGRHDLWWVCFFSVAGLYLLALLIIA